MSDDPSQYEQNCTFSILTENDVVTNIKGIFTKITGYPAEEFINRHIAAVFDILRAKIESTAAVPSLDTYIFTSELEPIEVRIFIMHEDARRHYYFFPLPGGELNVRFPATYKLLEDNHSGVAIYSYPDTVLLYANQKYLDLHNRPFDRMEKSLGKKLCEIVNPELAKTIGAIWKKTAETGNTFYGREIREISDRWKEKYFNITHMPIQIAGKTKFIITIVEEVTQNVLVRNHYERQADMVRQQKEQLEAIIQNISDALIMLDGNGSCTLLNQAARELFLPSAAQNGSPYDPGLGQAAFFDLNGAELPLENTPLRRVMRGEKFRELRLLTRLKHGSFYLNISGVPIFDPNGRFRMGILCCRDITDYLSRSKLLGIQKNQLEAIMDNVTEIILILDSHTKIVYANNVARGYFGNVSLKEMERLCRRIIIMDADRNILAREDRPQLLVMRTKEALRTRIIVCYGTAELYFDIAIVPILDENGNAVYYLASASDITGHVKSEISMQKKNDLLEQSLQLKDEFLSLISHEFKTPLTVINSAIQAMELLCRDELSAKARGFISKIKQNSYRQIRLVNNLLDITRINAGHLKINRKNSDIVFLTRAIIESVGLYARQKELFLQFLPDMEHRVIGLDEEKYERVLLNLLSNAIKFSPKGRSITVRLRCGDGRVIVDVVDEGIGIPEDKLEMIFERFGQVDSSLSRQAEGTGIGLSLVKLFVEALGGRIAVSSVIGAGSTFTISLPDGMTPEENTESALKEFTDHRIIQATVIEFSDIYM